MHMFPGVTVVLEESAHIGHGAVVHGARICRNVLIGMNAVIMDNATVGAGSIVGALCFVPSKMQIPERKIVVGNPAKIVKDVTDEMFAWKTEGTRLYQSVPASLRSSLVACDPLREVPAGRPEQIADVEIALRLRTRRDTPGALMALADGRYAVTGDGLVAVGGRSQLAAWAARRLATTQRGEVRAWWQEVAGVLNAPTG